MPECATDNVADEDLHFAERDMAPVIVAAAKKSKAKKRTAAQAELPAVAAEAVPNRALGVMPSDPESVRQADNVPEAVVPNRALGAMPSDPESVRGPGVAPVPLPPQPEVTVLQCRGIAIHLPPGKTRLGCPKCRQSKVGCKQCRTAAGLTYDANLRRWAPA